MTDRIKGFTVVLDKDYRDDDVEAIRSAIGMIYGVTKVTNIKANSDDYIVRTRAISEFKEKLYKLLSDDIS